MRAKLGILSLPAPSPPTLPSALWQLSAVIWHLEASQLGHYFYSLSRQRLVLEVRKALSCTMLDICRFNRHIFRIGAATTASENGFEDSLIQTLGRYSVHLPSQPTSTHPHQPTHINPSVYLLPVARWCPVMSGYFVMLSYL